MVPARRRTTRSSRARRYSTGSVTPLMQGPASTSITARSARMTRSSTRDTASSSWARRPGSRAVPAACGRAGRRAAARPGAGRSGIGRSPVPAGDCAGRSRTGSARASRAAERRRWGRRTIRPAARKAGPGSASRVRLQLGIAQRPVAGVADDNGPQGGRQRGQQGREQIARAVHAGQEYQRGHSGFRCGRWRIVAWRARHTRPIWMRRDPGICGAGVAGVECAGHADTIPEPP